MARLAYSAPVSVAARPLAAAGSGAAAGALQGGKVL